MEEMGSSKRRAEEVAMLLHQVSLPAARRDYELRSSSPAPRAATSSSQLVSRAFQNARATSFNATAHCELDVPVVLYNQRVFFSGPLSSGHGVAHPVVRAPAAPTREPKTVVDSDRAAALSSAHAHDFLGGRGRGGRIDRALSAGPVFHDACSTRSATPTTAAHSGPPPRRAFSGDLRAPKPSSRVNNNRPRSSELARELMRASSSRWSREDAQARSCDVTRAGAACDATRACEDEQKLEEKKGGESRRRPTASIAWDSLNESQPNSPQHELAAIPFQWEEAPGKPRENSKHPTTTTTRLAATPASTRAELAEASTPSSRAEEVEVRAHSHRFYSQCEQPTRKSSFDAASAHLISEVVSSIDLVAPAAAKFLVENWVSPAAAPEAHVAVPFQWEEAPGVPLKLDADEEAVCTAAKPVVALQLPPRLASPALAPPAAAKDEVRGRLRTRSMSGPLAGYYPHATPAQRRQLQQQQSPVTQRRSCSPSKRSISPSKRSISPSRIQAIAQHFSSSQRKRDGGHGALMASLEADLRDTAGSYGDAGLNLGRSASGALLSEFRRSPRWCNLSPSQGSVSPSQRIHALAKQLTCKIRLASAKTPTAALIKTSHGDPWSSTSSPVNLQDELHLSGPSSSNSDMDASSQTPVSEGAFSKSFSRVSYESFEHSFARRAAASNSPSPDDGLASPVASSSTDDFKETFNSSSSPGSPYLGGDSKESGKGSSPVGAAEGTTKAMAMIKTSPALRKNLAPPMSAHDMWAPTLASYFRCLEAATMISKPAARAPAAITSTSEQERCTKASEATTLHTRLPYTMASSASAEQNLLWKEYCESPHAAELQSKCLGVKFLPANFFVSRGKKLQSSECSSAAWSPHAGNASGEDGFRSPAYAATLELLSPSAELFRKKRRLVVGFTSRGIKLTMPSTRRRAQIMEAVSTSLKQALYKCAKRCCRKASSPPPLNSIPGR